MATVVNPVPAVNVGLFCETTTPTRKSLGKAVVTVVDADVPVPEVVLGDARFGSKGKAVSAPLIPMAITTASAGELRPTVMVSELSAELVTAYQVSILTLVPRFCEPLRVYVSADESVTERTVWLLELRIPTMTYITSDVPVVVRTAERVLLLDTTAGNAQPIPAQSTLTLPVAGKVVGEATPAVAYSPEPPSFAEDVSDKVNPVPAVSVSLLVPAELAA